jgi:hypothetical protein
MGLGEEFSQSEEQDDDNSGGDSSIAYIYIRKSDNNEAYHLMSEKHGGSAYVRNRLKSLPDEAVGFSDQHDFFQKMVEALEPVLRNNDYEEVFDLLMVDSSIIAQYLDENPEVRAEVVNHLTDDEDQDEAEPAPADD